MALPAMFQTKSAQGKMARLATSSASPSPRRGIQLRQESRAASTLTSSLRARSAMTVSTPCDRPASPRNNAKIAARAASPDEDAPRPRRLGKQPAKPRVADSFAHIGDTDLGSLACESVSPDAANPACAGVTSPHRSSTRMACDGLRRTWTFLPTPRSRPRLASHATGGREAVECL